MFGLKSNIFQGFRYLLRLLALLLGGCTLQTSPPGLVALGPCWLQFSPEPAACQRSSKKCGKANGFVCFGGRECCREPLLGGEGGSLVSFCLCPPAPCRSSPSLPAEQHRSTRSKCIPFWRRTLLSFSCLFFLPLQPSKPFLLFF